MSIWVIIYRFAYAVLALLLLSALAWVFYPPLRDARQLERKRSVLEEEIRLDREMLKLLKEKQERLLRDPRFVERIAREELGLAKPGETVFKFTDEEPAAAKARP
jgi:cell division protein FtsB